MPCASTSFAGRSRTPGSPSESPYRGDQASIQVARVAVGPLSAVPEGRAVAVRAGTLRVALFRNGESVFAIEDRCTHRGFPLNDGLFSGATVRCRNHGACFDLATGAVVQGPASRPIRVFPVEIADGELILIVPDTV